MRDCCCRASCKNDDTSEKPQMFSLHFYISFPEEIVAFVQVKIKPASDNLMPEDCFILSRAVSHQMYKCCHFKPTL